jgi:two-component system alkaline phosphatase synthesis response regulator PhoP
MTEKILIIEDEQQIAQWVRTYFENAGFATLVAGDGKEGLALAQRETPALIVLDLNLPGMDGIDLCRALRQDKRPQVAQVPIIMLTARVEESDRLIGLELGADDYVVKPFSPRELVARARAIFRRLERTGAPVELLKDGDLVVDVTAHLATLAGATLNLTPSEFALLVVLLQNRGQALSRTQLVELALGHDYEGLERSIDVYVRQLRAKVENDPAHPQRIVTVFGVGYRYV